ncbi:MAG: DMT family transporter [Candidatus Adiutricales bacterium]
MPQNGLRWQLILILLVLALIWGVNLAVVKIGARDLPPLFMAGLRSLIASLCLFIWIKIKGMAIIPSRIVLIHGVVIGLLFGIEFGCLYVGLNYTLASRASILLYFAPFAAAIGAHLFLKGDRLNPWKIAGLILAFVGITALFARGLDSSTLENLTGDFLSLAAGILWAATTIYLKKYLAHRAVPLQTLFYQVFFSAPLLIVLSLILENPLDHSWTFSAGFSMIYQSIFVAFLSYLVWFELIHRYPVSLLHAFTFFTPVFGTFISGVLILGEAVTASLVLALSLVSMGMVLVNRQPARQEV